MTATLGRLVRFASVSPWRIAVSAVLGVLAVGFGVALMTAAGYLISRAAEQPPILSLTVTIVAVRFFGLARPLARYLERIASHDVALRALGRIRTRFYERIEPLAPGQLVGYRRGELLGRMVGDVDSLQGLYVRSRLPRASRSGGVRGVTRRSTPLPQFWRLGWSRRRARTGARSIA
jgi:ABC-type transport system involved in cytochrome bd biosynthesis fused ATPase/permease subunit